MPPSIAIILKGYPRLSETFIAEEIHALEQTGMAITLFSLRAPTDPHTHPVHQAIRARVAYLPEYLHRQPLRVLRAWWQVRRQPQYRPARLVWWRDLRRELPPNWRNRARRFGQAMVLAAELPPETTLLYAHFLHTPASVARYAAILRTLPWSCSAHAKDIWTIPEWEKRDKLNHCRWLTTCTRANWQHLRALAKHPQRVALNYHGLALSRFAKHAPQRSNRDGGDPTRPVQILSIGRAVTKKGYRGLLNALADLPPTLHWQLTHIGAGPLLPDLRQQAHALGIAHHINWLGPQAQQTVLDWYRKADFFALNCCIAADGDRDGLPNVLVEAQSQELAVVATNLSGIPELIQDRVNGLLVAANDRHALCDALRRLITDPILRRRLGKAGREIVFAQFDMTRNFAKLHSLFTAHE